MHSLYVHRGIPAFNDDNSVNENVGLAICNYGARWLADIGVHYGIRVFSFCDAAIVLEADQKVPK